jgi:hypothetical protein
LAEAALAFQIGDVFRAEMKVAQIVYQLLHAGHNRITGVIWHIAVKHIKISDGIPYPLLVIAVGHCEFIEVGEHGQILVQIQKNHPHFVKVLTFFLQNRAKTPFFIEISARLYHIGF